MSALQAISKIFRSDGRSRYRHLRLWIPETPAQPPPPPTNPAIWVGIQELAFWQRAPMGAVWKETTCACRSRTRSRFSKDSEYTLGAFTARPASICQPVRVPSTCCKTGTTDGGMTVRILPPGVSLMAFVYRIRKLSSMDIELMLISQSMWNERNWPKEGASESGLEMSGRCPAKDSATRASAESGGHSSPVWKGRVPRPEQSDHQLCSSPFPNNGN